jgi:predicted HTH domain antitoxin
MQIQLEIPPNLPDSVQQSPAEFARDAKLAMAAKLYEIGRLSSGMAAAFVGMERVPFLHELQRFHVAMLDQDEDELRADIAHA